MCSLRVPSSVASALSDQLKSGQRLSLQNRPREGAGDVRFFYDTVLIELACQRILKPSVSHRRAPPKNSRFRVTVHADPHRA
jgi:hypothetical protein